MKSKDGEWWNYSWNVAPGCTKVSDECAHCWALTMAKRLQGMKKPGYEGLVDAKGNWTGKVNLMNWRLEDPLKLKTPHVIAVNLMGDLFHPQIPDAFIGQVFGIMGKANQHTYMVLTKRPDRMLEVITRINRVFGALPNIWLGTTAGTQRSANERWSSMALIAQWGWNTWVSSEPRLEAIHWRGWAFLKMLVTGGESGPYARPMVPAWPRADRKWCEDHGVDFWFKQWGEWGPTPPVNGEESQLAVATFGDERMYRVGRKLAGRRLDGAICGVEL